MRKPTVKKLLKDLDALVAQIVFKRDKACVTCPLWKEIKPGFIGSWVMQPGHYITRGAKTIRWDLRNVYKTCKTCNFLHEYHPEVLANYVLHVLGPKGFEKLVFDGNQVQPSIKAHQLEELYMQLSVEGGE